MSGACVLLRAGRSDGSACSCPGRASAWGVACVPAAPLSIPTAVGFFGELFWPISCCVPGCGPVGILPASLWDQPPLPPAIPLCLCLLVPGLLPLTPCLWIAWIVFLVRPSLLHRPRWNCIMVLSLNLPARGPLLRELLLFHRWRHHLCLCVPGPGLSVWSFPALRPESGLGASPLPRAFCAQVCELS